MNDKDILKFDDDDDEDIVLGEQENVTQEEPVVKSTPTPRTKVRPSQSINRPQTGASGRRKLINTTDEDATTQIQNKPHEDQNIGAIIGGGDTEGLIRPEDVPEPTKKKKKAKPSKTLQGHGGDTEGTQKVDTNTTTVNESAYEDYNDVIVEDSYIKELREKEAKAQKKVKTPEQIKKRKIILIVIGVIFVLVIILLNVRKSNLNNKDVIYEPVNLDDYKFGQYYANLVGEQGATEENTDNSGSLPNDPSEEGTTEGQTPSVSDLNINRNSDTLSIGEYTFISKTEEVKLNKDDGYTKVESEYYFGVSSITSGYDKVVNTVNEYNNDTSNKSTIKLISKDELESENITLVEIDIDLKYPEDYPTNLSKGDIGSIPEPKLEILGTFKSDKDTSNTEETDKSNPEETEETDTSNPEETEEETEELKDYSNSIVVKGQAYSITEPIKVYTKPSVINIKTGFTYKYIVQLPIGAEPDDYEIYVELEGKRIQVNTVSVTK